MAELLRLFFKMVYELVLFIVLIAMILLYKIISLIPIGVFSKIGCYIVLLVLDILSQMASMVNSKESIVEINSLADELRSLLNEK